MKETVDIFGESYAVYEPEGGLPTGKWNLRRVDKSRIGEGFEIMEVYYDSKDRPVGACAFSVSQTESANFTKIVSWLQSAQGKPVLRLDKKGNFIKELSK